jgi:hypothetical protein
MPFKATPRTSKIAGMMAGNALDKVPLVNIPSFVICQKLTQMAGGTPTPCMPAPTVWQDTYPAKVGGAEALLFRSCITCPVGQGKIEFMTSGQLPMPPDVSQELKEVEQDAQESLDAAEKEKNSVGEASFAEGLIPIWGSGRDLIHAAQTGDKMGVALNAAFLVWDVASVAAGVLSFGTATAGMMAGKAGVRAALKAGGKVAMGMAKKKLAATAAKALALKKAIPSALKAFSKKVPKLCVTACFPAGTPVAVEGGYKNIEAIQVGDLVWSWHEETGNLALKPVTQTLRRDSDAIIELRLGSDTVRATPEHPFWANGAWKQAGELVEGDELLRSDGQTMPVGEVTHHTEQPTTVYNFEVADWHTYLVSWWMLVVHNSTICLKGTAKKIAKAAKSKKKALLSAPTKVKSKRLQYLGRTPGKKSSTGKAVIKRMEGEKKIRELTAGKKEVLGPDGNWYEIEKTDMGHLDDAVSWWNREGRQHGAKSKEVRDWMKDAKNYELEPSSINRSRGARLTETYLPPLK